MISLQRHYLFTHMIPLDRLANSEGFRAAPFGSSFYDDDADGEEAGPSNGHSLSASVTISPVTDHNNRSFNQHHHHSSQQQSSSKINLNDFANNHKVKLLNKCFLLLCN